MRFEFLLYDVTSTFFEGQALKNAKAARVTAAIRARIASQSAWAWWSRRRVCRQPHRHDHTTGDRHPLGGEVWPGPTRVGGLDRGRVSEANLAWLRQRGATYLVGTPKSQLKAHEAALLETTGWQEACPGLEVKLVPTPGGIEQFILCRSTNRGAKERAMLDRQLDRLKTELNQIHTRLGRAPEADREKAGRQIGRWLGQYPAAAGVLSVTLERDADAQACGLAITERAEKLEWSRRVHEAHLWRPNHPGGEPRRRRGGGISS